MTMKERTGMRSRAIMKQAAMKSRVEMKTKANRSLPGHSRMSLPAPLRLSPPPLVLAQAAPPL